MTFTRAVRHATMGLLAMAAILGPLPAAAEAVTVFAAASLKGALDRAAAGWTAETGTATTLSYAGTAALARQIEQGAPADVFIAANEDWMDRLEGEGLIRAGTRRDLLGNRLVLIASDTEADEVAIAPGFDLAGLLGDGKLAMALVDAVPAGIYGKAALRSLGVWDAVASQVVQADNVRAALALVATGEAPLGVVYATDAAAEPAVAVLGTFPADSHPPIVYPAALVADGTAPEAQSFLDYLAGGAGRAIFEAEGFAVLP